MPSIWLLITRHKLAPKRNRETKKPTGAIGSVATENTDTMSPIFAFNHMPNKTGYSVNCCPVEHQAAAIKQIYLLSSMTWQQIRNAPKHGLGTEKIEKNAIKVAIPDTVTDDVTFLALRYNGKAPMVGYRDGRVFNVLFFDHTFTLYDHG